MNPADLERALSLWKALDWSKTNRQLAAETGFCLDTVRRRRKLLNERKATSYPNARRDWESVDWSKRNRTMARELGCKESAVARRRNRMAPDTIRYPKMRDNWRGRGCG